MKKYLNRESFLTSSTNLKREKVELEEGTVYVRELSGRALLEYNEKIEELKKVNPELTTSNSLELIALLVSKSACDEKGNLLFNKDDVEALMNNSMSTLKTLAEKAMEVSGLSQSKIDEVNKQLKNAAPSASTEA